MKRTRVDHFEPPSKRLTNNHVPVSYLPGVECKSLFNVDLYFNSKFVPPQEYPLNLVVSNFSSETISNSDYQQDNIIPLVDGVGQKDCGDKFNSEPNELPIAVTNIKRETDNCNEIKPSRINSVFYSKPVAIIFDPPPKRSHSFVKDEIESDADDDELAKSLTTRPVKRLKTNSCEFIKAEPKKENATDASGTVPSVKSPTSQTELDELSHETEQYIKVKSIFCSPNGCGQKLATPFLFGQHMKRMHRRLSFQCPLPRCGKYLHDKNHWKSHTAKEHSDETEWKCSACDKSFSANCSLPYTHSIYHHQVGQFVCSKPNCHFGGNFRITVVRHYRQKHFPQAEGVKLPARELSELAHASRSKYSILAIQCTQVGCDVEFAIKDKDQFYRHSYYVHGMMPNRCLASHCGVSFGEITQLAHHVRHDHSAITSWNCAFCNQVFVAYGDLKWHIVCTHQRGLFGCMASGCPFRTRTRYQVIEHYDQVHLQKGIESFYTKLEF